MTSATNFQCCASGSCASLPPPASSPKGPADVRNHHPVPGLAGTHRSVRLPDRPDHLRAPGLGRAFPDSDDDGIRMGTGHVQLGHRHSEPALGCGTALRRRDGGSIRHAAGAVRRRRALRAGPRRDGLCDHARHASPGRRRAHRLRPLRLLVQSGARRVRQAPAGEVAAHGLRRRHGGGLLRPVPLPAHRQRAHRCCRLAADAPRLRGSRPARPAPLARARDAADGGTPPQGGLSRPAASRSARR